MKNKNTITGKTDYRTGIYNVAQHPILANLELGRIALQYSRHAVYRALEKNIVLPRQSGLTVPAGVVVEIERTAGITTKLIIRLDYSKSHDLILVLRPLQDGLFFVNTVWKNHKEDKHATLDRSRVIA